MKRFEHALKALESERRYKLMDKLNWEAMKILAVVSAVS